MNGMGWDGMTRGFWLRRACQVPHGGNGKQNRPQTISDAIETQRKNMGAEQQNPTAPQHRHSMLGRQK